MTQDHPITPQPELVASLRNSAPHGIRDAGVTREIWLIENAYAAGADRQLKLDAEQISQAWQKGADQELEACCEWLSFYSAVSDARDLRGARRPKPPSLKEQALAELEKVDMLWDTSEFGADTLSALDIIRRAIEQLPDAL